MRNMKKYSENRYFLFNNFPFLMIESLCQNLMMESE